MADVGRSGELANGRSWALWFAKTELCCLTGLEKVVWLE